MNLSDAIFILLNIYHVTMKVTGHTHAKFLIVNRSEFVSGLLAGFTNHLCRVSVYCTRTHLGILTVAMLYNFIAKHHKSDVVQTVSAAGLLQYRLLVLRGR